MAYDIDTGEGTVTLPVEMVNGRLFFCTRAVDEATWDAVAQSVKLVDADGAGIEATISRIGPVVLSWTTNADGEQIPDSVDTRYHVNVLLDAKTTQLGLWKQWALSWMEGSDIIPNSDETGKTNNGIDLIEPTSISHPRNRIG